MALHITKVAFGIDSLEAFEERIAARRAAGGFTHVTRYLPRRHEEMAGGSLYWILRHQLVARSPILGFSEAENGRTAIHLEPRLILVQAHPKRAHQGWRYLEGKDAPADLDAAGEAVAAMPPALIGKLNELSLL
ncbi:DUF1489 family protein [Stakelama sediminis]|uniref:DUF1489 family protein n=1 Tax=Stakelama sediminis TaxID=463200 RepID=A0A840YXK2_9SPHN|nr:DUF1489 domain-containing protein [Stakelama sediminis]MBB5718272.1 hypothetical protein [Stakelama sediminis]